MSEYHPLRLTRFDFDVADFLSSPDVASMTASEVGQYILLLCAAWIAGRGATLPNDPKTLAKLARVRGGVSPKVMAKFVLTRNQDGVLVRTNLRLSMEWKAACARAKVRQEKAQNAAKNRWNDDAQSMPQAYSEHAPSNAPSNAQAMLGPCLAMPPSPSPSPKEEEKSKPLRAQGVSPVLTEEDDTARFAQFAEAYPPERKPTGPVWEDALKIWKRLSVAEQLEAIKCLPGWKEFWGEDRPRYIPTMGKFLHEKRWHGEPPTAASGTGSAKPGATPTPRTKPPRNELNAKGRALYQKLGVHVDEG